MKLRERKQRLKTAGFDAEPLSGKLDNGGGVVNKAKYVPLVLDSTGSKRRKRSPTPASCSKC